MQSVSLYSADGPGSPHAQDACSGRMGALSKSAPQLPAQPASALSQLPPHAVVAACRRGALLSTCSLFERRSGAPLCVAQGFSVRLGHAFRRSRLLDGGHLLLPDFDTVLPTSGGSCGLQGGLPIVACCRFCRSLAALFGYRADFVSEPEPNWPFGLR
jgi:hypothetical protein